VAAGVRNTIILGVLGLCTAIVRELGDFGGKFDLSFNTPLERAISDSSLNFSVDASGQSRGIVAVFLMSCKEVKREKQLSFPKAKDR
jgi:hypothetical protein